MIYKAVAIPSLDSDLKADGLLLSYGFTIASPTRIVISARRWEPNSSGNFRHKRPEVSEFHGRGSCPF